jgi:hypothetical protein
MAVTQSRRFETRRFFKLAAGTFPFFFFRRASFSVFDFLSIARLKAIETEH